MMKKIYTSVALIALFVLPIQSSGLALSLQPMEVIDEPMTEPTAPVVAPTAHYRHEPSPVSPPITYLRDRTLRWSSLQFADDALPARIANATNTIPSVGMVITGDTTLEPGTYTNNQPSTTFITIAADNVTLDCNGAILEDVTSQHLTDGIKIESGRSNVTVTNCTLKNMFLGIISGSSDPDGPISTGLTITQNVFLQYATDVELYYLNYWSHLMIRNTDNSEISYNTSEPFDYELHWANGIFMSLWESDHNNVHHNTSVSLTGIHVTLNSDGNNIHDNEFGFMGWKNGGIEIDRASDSNNVHHNQASYYNYEPTSPTVAGSGVMLHGFTASDAPRYQEAAHHNIISDNTTVSNYKMIAGISLVHDTHDNLITRNTVNGAYVGIETYFGETNDGSTTTYYYPHQNTIDSNVVIPSPSEFDSQGIWLGNGTNHITITNNQYNGAFIGVRVLYDPESTSPQVPITDITVNDNIFITNGYTAMYIGNEAAAHRWTIYHNNFQGNMADPNLWMYGIFLNAGNTDVQFYENTLVDNGYYLDGTYNQLLAYPGTILSVQGRGNYYSDYDEPSEGCTDVDLNGICDLPRNFNTGTIDHYPLVNPTFCADGNCPPVLRPIAPVTVNELDLAIIRVDAYDYEHDPLTITFSDARFQSFDGCWPGRNAWVWGTNENSSGSYPVTVSVNDGLHQVQQSVLVTVRDTCYINKWGKMRCWNAISHMACY